MDLLNRYLNAVRPLLPRKAQGDILRELSDDILSQMEEKEAALGRPLNEGEQEEIIKSHGHPIVVAARYGRKHYLIGPELFPFYWLFLKIGVAGALLVRLIVAIITILLSAHPQQETAAALLSVPLVLGPVFFWITISFAAAEICSSFFNLNLKRDWSPRSLPVIGKHSSVISRPNSAAELIFGILFIVWWQLSPAAPYLVIGPTPNLIAPGPIWATLHWPILLLMVATVLQAAVNLIYPHTTTARTRIRLAIQAGAFVILCLIFRAGNWVIAGPAASGSTKYDAIVGLMNQGLMYCFIAAILIAGAQLVWGCIQHFRDSMLRSETSHCKALPGYK